MSSQHGVTKVSTKGIVTGKKHWRKKNGEEGQRIDESVAETPGETVAMVVDVAPSPTPQQQVPPRNSNASQSTVRTTPSDSLLTDLPFAPTLPDHQPPSNPRKARKGASDGRAPSAPPKRGRGRPRKNPPSAKRDRVESEENPSQTKQARTI